MSQLNATTPFSFLGSFRSIPVSKLTAVHNGAATLIPTGPRSRDPMPRTELSDVSNTRTPADGKLKAKFPVKLYKVLQECESGAVRWSEDGTRVIVRYSQFQGEYLGKVFKTANIASFVRQLNLYGFRKECEARHKRRHGSSTEEHVFQHPAFTREHPLLHTIHRSVPSPYTSKNTFPLPNSHLIADPSEHRGTGKNTDKNTEKKEDSREHAHHDSHSLTDSFCGDGGRGRPDRETEHAILTLACLSARDEQVLEEECVEPYILATEQQREAEFLHELTYDRFHQQDCCSATVSTMTMTASELQNYVFSGMAQQTATESQGHQVVDLCTSSSEDEDSFIDVETISDQEETGTSPSRKKKTSPSGISDVTSMI